MSISKEVLLDFNLYYRFANAYAYNLGISNSNFPLSLFKKDLKRFDDVYTFLSSESVEIPLEIKNQLIILINCFGKDIVEKTLNFKI